MKIILERVYGKHDMTTGYRVLVDRLWPRGIKKESLKFDEWLKDIGPSDELRQWFGHDPAKFDEFKKRYTKELDKLDLPKQLLSRAGRKDLVLLFGAKDETHNQAVVLKHYLSATEAN